MRSKALCLSLALLFGAFDGDSGAFAADAVDDALPVGQVESVLSFPAGESPEGIAIDRDGALYVSLRGVPAGGVRASSLVRVEPETGTAAAVATLDEDVPEALPGALGVVLGPGGAIFVALVSGDPATHGVWRIDAGGDATHIAGSEAMAFPNALAFDDDGNLYVTNTVMGEVWRFASGEGPGEVWVQDPALADPGNDLLPKSIGANGIAFAPPNTLYVANTEGALLAEIPIEADGSPGAVRVVAQGLPLLSIDGIAIAASGAVYAVIAGAALVGNDPLVRIDPQSGTVVPLMADAGAFDAPTSLAFGTGGKADRRSLYVVNAALLGPGAAGPGVVQVGVGEEGRDRRFASPASAAPGDLDLTH